MVLYLRRATVWSNDCPKVEEHLIESRWCHQMETFSALLTICAGNSPITGEFPAQRPVTRSFNVFFDLRLNKRLSKQSRGWWFETPSRPLWRQGNAWRIWAKLIVKQNEIWTGCIIHEMRCIAFEWWNTQTWMQFRFAKDTVNTSRPRQHGHHFVDEIFKVIFLE